VFAAFAVLYGICETVNGNWLQLDMTSELGASTTVAALALTAFWAMVTVGRVVFATVGRWVPERLTYHALPFLLAGAFALIALLPNDTPYLGVLAFGFAGLGCSALLPLTIGFGQEELATVAAAVAGASSPSTSSGTASPPSGSDRSSTRASSCLLSTGSPRRSQSGWDCCRSRSCAAGARSPAKIFLTSFIPSGWWRGSGPLTNVADDRQSHYRGGTCDGDPRQG
jgi:hypothetical protein